MVLIGLAWKEVLSVSRFRSAAWLIALAVVTSGATLRADEVFTPEHVAKLQSVRSAEISPDGRYIAYTLSVPRRPYEDESGSAWSELHVVDSSGVSRPFITGEVSVGSVQWTPDGEGIAFLAKRGKDEHRSLYVIPVDGGEARRVLSHETSISRYAFRPDGHRVAFLARDKEPKIAKKLKKKGFNQEVFEEGLRNVHVWIGTPDDEEAESRKLSLKGSVSSIHWNPAGTQLVVGVAPSSLIDDRYMNTRIRVIDAQEGTVLTKIDNPGKLGSIAWSPNGRHLAVIAAEDVHDPSAGRLMVVPAGGGELRNLLPNYHGQVSAAAWQDNETVMYLGDVGAWSTLGEVAIDGSGRKLHIAEGRAVLSRMRLTADGQTAVMLGQSDRHPNEVYVMGHGDTTPRRLTDSNPWLSKMRFAKQEIIHHEAGDGLMLEGILIRPLDEKPGQRYPLILCVHGGPEGHRSNGWLTRYSGPGQVGAARGYAVFYPNYRGSTARGVEFSKLGQGDYAGKEFDDLIDAVDHLIGMGLVDEKKVGITGGSYGGFATAWCSTYHSHRFAAGVMFVGISDHISKFGTTDIPQEMFLVHSRKYPWEDWEFFLERSPVYHAQKGHTPLLIMGGKNDTRVDPSQSMELYRYLKVLGKAPVRLVRYPGEGHGNRKSGARYDYNVRMIRWFDHYLKGPGGDPPPYDIDYGFVDEEKKKDETEGDD